MFKTEITLQEWRDQENPYGNPKTRPESEIWEMLLTYFQQNISHKYLKHFHEYRFTPENPKRLKGSGIGRSRVGRYQEILTIFYQAQNQ